MNEYLNIITDWVLVNYIELLATVSGLLYIYFSVKQNILLWLFGIISSALYIYVYFSAKFYADMSLQFYYLVISFYGWYFWIFGKTKNSQTLKISRTNKKTALVLLALTILFFGIYVFILKFTDTDVIYWDSFTTAAGITATWMLVKKKIEQWIIWVIVDFVSIILYVYKELYITAILFVVYTILAVVGYYQWKKDLDIEVQKQIV